MKKGLVEIVFILDRSGSMCGLEKETIGGFNSTIEKQRNEAGDAYVSTVLFDGQMEVLHDRVPIREIPPLTTKEYFARGCTALLDAIGNAIHHIGNVHKYAREEDRPEKTIVIITTDGYENASRKYSPEKVKMMIERQKSKYGWEFLFLGANIDAIQTARSFGIDENHSANYMPDSIGMEKLYDAEERFIRMHRCELSAADLADWKSDVEADYRFRKNRNCAGKEDF